MSFDFTESVVLKLPNVKDQMASFTESDSYRENNKLITEIAAIHAGLTSNFNMYSADALEGSLGSWVTPYARPIIMNHDEYSEPIGRVMKSRIAEEADGTRYVMLQAAITDPVAIEKILDGRYLTGSVGGKADSAKCSVCHVDWAKSNMESSMPCRHRRGEVYEGKLAYFDLGELSFREYSFVNIPADQHSGVRSITKDNAAHAHQAKDDDALDSAWTHTVKMYAMDMNNPVIKEMTTDNSAHNILESYTKKRATAAYMDLKGSFLSVSALDYLENDDQTSKIEDRNNTIKNEFDPDSEQLILSQLDDTSRKEKAMTGKAVTTTEEEVDDILAVSEQLSADLAAADTADSSGESTTEGDAEGLSDASDDETDPEDPKEEETTDSEETEEVEEQLVDPNEEDDEQAADADADAEKTPEAQEDPGKEPDEVKPEVESESDERDARIEELQTENAKLRTALKQMLAERVVDVKIAKGVAESAQRATLVEEHTKRTASSLADALKDLEHFPTQARESVETPEIEIRSAALGTEEGATTQDEIVVTESAPRNPQKVAEELFTDVLSGRRKLR